MQRTNFDSDFCGSLPIHLTNLIQPYGALLVVDQSNGVIIQASENVNAVFQRTAQELVGKRLQEFIEARDYEQMLEKLSKNLREKVPAIWSVRGRRLLTFANRKHNYLLIEIDLHEINLKDQDTFIEVYQELKYAMTSVESSNSVQDACETAATELKRLSGFDKVMVYRFDEQWNGYVVAEVKEEGMESYLGFTFPASDIPRQARELYLKNPYRFIPDRDYKPVKLFPVINPATQSFLDLSDCNLRSVAAVHLEYLKNMDVAASMSTRILKGDKLWGLIACHHRTPKHMGYEMCSIFEMMASIISVKITSMENQEEHEFNAALTENYAQLIERIYTQNNLDSALLSKNGLMKLFNASGLLITRTHKMLKAGEVPDAEYLDELVLWVSTRQLKKVYATSSLPADYENANDFRNKASGVLVIPINVSRDEYIILFRPEIVTVINWGGNPEQRIRFDGPAANEKNYHPRNSFKQWQQTVVGVSLPWRNDEMKIAEALRSFIYEYETSQIIS